MSKKSVGDYHCRKVGCRSCGCGGGSTSDAVDAFSSPENDFQRIYSGHHGGARALDWPHAAVYAAYAHSEILGEEVIPEAQVSDDLPAYSQAHTRTAHERSTAAQWSRAAMAQTPISCNPPSAMSGSV
jgi:hypothetical protein